MEQGEGSPLTSRQAEFLEVVQDLFRRGEAVHYSEVAQRLGVSRWTAYDVLSVLAQRGFLRVEREQRPEPSLVGRCRVLFRPVLPTGATPGMVDEASRGALHGALGGSAGAPGAALGGSAGAPGGALAGSAGAPGGALGGSAGAPGGALGGGPAGVRRGALAEGAVGGPAGGDVRAELGDWWDDRLRRLQLEIRERGIWPVLHDLLGDLARVSRPAVFCSTVTLALVLALRAVVRGAEVPSVLSSLLSWLAGADTGLAVFAGALAGLLLQHGVPRDLHRQLVERLPAFEQEVSALGQQGKETLRHFTLSAVREVWGPELCAGSTG